jgi:hypothetical protein
MKGSLAKFIERFDYTMQVKWPCMPFVTGCRG